MYKECTQQDTQYNGQVCAACGICVWLAPATTTVSPGINILLPRFPGNTYVARSLVIILLYLVLYHPTDSLHPLRLRSQPPHVFVFTHLTSPPPALLPVRQRPFARIIFIFFYIDFFCPLACNSIQAHPFESPSWRRGMLWYTYK